MDIKKIQTIIDLIVQTDINEFELKEGEHSLKFKRQQIPAETTTTATDSVIEEKKMDQHRQIITAPVSGIFYRENKTEKQTFVEIGGYVNKNEPLAVIETMTTIETIYSPQAGVIESILAHDNEQVIHGAVLFYLRTD